MKKTVLAILISIMMSVCFVSCNKTEVTEDKDASTESVSEESVSTDQEAESVEDVAKKSNESSSKSAKGNKKVEDKQADYAAEKESDSNMKKSDNSHIDKKTADTTKNTKTTDQSLIDSNSQKSSNNTTTSTAQKTVVISTNVTTEKVAGANNTNQKTSTKVTATQPLTKEDTSSTCSHSWVWAKKTIHHDAVTHIEERWSEPVTNPIYRKGVICTECRTQYNSLDDYYNQDSCGGGWGDTEIFDHYETSEPELLGTYTVVDQEAYDETVNDYQYCSKCGEKK